MQIDESMIERDQLPEIYRNIYDLVANVSTEATAKTTVIELSKIFGGSIVYVPMIDTIAKEGRNKMIRAEFNGANVRQLARKYNMTNTTIRKILQSKPRVSG